MQRLVRELVFLSVALVAGCGSHAQYSLDVGGDDGGALALADGGGGGGPGALDAHIEENHVAVTLVQVGCAGSCATVQAIATGGRPPYSYAWENGSTNAVRRLCPTADSGYVVKVTDTGTSGEFGHPAQTAQAAVTAQILNCSDAGADAGADGAAPSAETVYWTTWSAVTLGNPGAAQGTISPPGGDVAVSYTGQATSASAPTGQPSNWALGVVTFDPMSTYVSATVANGPPSSGMIEVSGSTLTQTITFSAPVRDPLLAVITLGDYYQTTTWTFDATPSVLSTGPGIVNMNGTLTASGQDLIGGEGNGVVQFTGTFTSLSFTATASDNGMFTVGIRGRQ